MEETVKTKTDIEIKNDNIFDTKLAHDNWVSKYQYGDETPVETQKRVAKALASVEEYPDYWYPIFLRTLVNIDEEGNALGLKATPGGRITANAGTQYEKASMFNCYINGPVKNATIEYEREIPGSDKTIDVRYKTPDTGDNMYNIVLTLMEQAKTLGFEGGWGINMSFIRPRSTVIKGIGIQHPGVIKFLEVFDKMAEVIVSGNNDGYEDTLKNYLTDDEIQQIKNMYDGPLKKMARKGAMLVSLDVSHPDIEEFIKAKQEAGRLTKFNISVMVTDEFMECVRNDDYFDLKFEGTIYKRVKARELYDLIMSSTYNRAEPGVLFYDNMQKNNPISYMGEVNSTNPCGEIGGNPHTTTVCLLGSLNLTQYVNKDRTFDFEEYKKDVQVFARMLDNVNDLQEQDLPPYLWAIKNVRQYGMGVNGLGSTLYMMGLKYNSAEALEFADEINRAKMNETMRTSALLAEEKGPAEMFDEEQYFDTYYWNYFLEGKIDEDVAELVKKNGVRNLKQTTMPPLGNSSVICDMISNSLEPVFLPYYERTYIADKWPEGLNKDNVKEHLEEVKAGDATVWQGEYNGVQYYYEPHNRGLCITETVYDYGYKWVKENYPEDIENDADYLVNTKDISVDDHIDMQDVFQQYVDQSVSKTSNIPKDYPFDDFKDLYFEAWNKGLNGFTTYREGTMEAVLKEKNEQVKKEEGKIVKTDAPERPKTLECDVYHATAKGKNWVVIVGLLEGEPYEVFGLAEKKVKLPRTWKKGQLTKIKKGQYNLEFPEKEFVLEDVTDHFERDEEEALTRMISTSLRHGTDVKFIVEQLKKSEGTIVSFSKAIARTLNRYVSEEDLNNMETEDMQCPEGGKHELVFEAGCSKCTKCGQSNCG